MSYMFSDGFDSIPLENVPAVKWATAYPQTVTITIDCGNGLSASEIVEVVPGQPFTFTVTGVDAMGRPVPLPQKEECVQCDLTIRRKFKLEE